MLGFIFEFQAMLKYVPIRTVISVDVWAIRSPRVVLQGLYIPVKGDEVAAERLCRRALVLSIELLHLFVGQGKVKDAKVFLNPVLFHALGDDNDAILHLVPEKHLCRGL